jgi:hypothetical protein
MTAASLRGPFAVPPGLAARPEFARDRVARDMLLYTMQETRAVGRGYAFGIRKPTTAGFGNPKFVTAMFVTNRHPGGIRGHRLFTRFSLA